jgi:hypothetical protein
VKSPDAGGRVPPDGDFPPTIQLFVGGHIHVFETLTLGGARPPQLVVANSGTLLDPPITTPLRGLTIEGLAVADGVSLAQFGFATLEAIERGWRAVLRDVAGAPLLEVRATRPRADLPAPRRAAMSRHS